MHLRRFSSASGLSAAIGIACALGAAPLAAQAPASTSPAPAGPPAAPTVPVSATSQCVEGPGAPPADPTKVTRVPASAAGAVSEPGSAPADAPAGPDPVLLELGVHAGVSVRADDAPTFTTTRRVGPTAGGSIFVWTSRTLAFGAGYSYADLSRAETSPLAPEAVSITYRAHAFIAEARVAPFRFSSFSVFAFLGGGVVWQEASLRATFPPITGSPGGSLQCDAGSNAELGFRAGVAAKAHLAGPISFLADAAFLGYRFTSDVLDGCAPGSGTAQTLMVRAGFAYDVDISRAVR